MQFVQRDFSGELKRIMKVEGIKQPQLAKQIGISQSTISRVLKRGYSRQGPGRAKIERFLDETALKLHNVSAFPTDLELAVREVWDKTPAHAQILAGLIRATRGLVPTASPDRNE
jgi:transcriptional regulator with XRE-family HTH domain